MEIDSDIDLYDSDRIKINEVVAKVRDYIGRNRATTTRDFVREVKERYEDAGYVVDVRMYTREDQEHLPEEERQYLPHIQITGRTEAGQQEFDHDRMRHEVRSNILGQNQQGDIQSKTVGQTGFERRKSGLIVPN